MDSTEDHRPTAQEFRAGNRKQFFLTYFFRVVILPSWFAHLISAPTETTTTQKGAVGCEVWKTMTRRALRAR